MSDNQSTTIIPAPRRRGAPVGNTNALKHGFYAKKFKHSDLSDLEGYEFSGLREEIQMMRVCIRHVVELSTKSGDLHEAANLLRILSLASISLTRLVNTQHLLIRDEPSPLQQALNDMLRELDQEGEQNP